MVTEHWLKARIEILELKRFQPLPDTISLSWCYRELATKEQFNGLHTVSPPDEQHATPND